MSPGNWSEEPARIVRLIDSRQPRRVRLWLPAACSIAPDGLFSAAADSMYCLASARSRLAEGRRRRVLVLRNSTLDTELVSPNYFEKRQYRILRARTRRKHRKRISICADHVQYRVARVSQLFPAF